LCLLRKRRLKMTRTKRRVSPRMEPIFALELSFCHSVREVGAWGGGVEMMGGRLEDWEVGDAGTAVGSKMRLGAEEGIAEDIGIGVCREMVDKLVVGVVGVAVMVRSDGFVKTEVGFDS
jgi:hypothetical protein